MISEPKCKEAQQTLKINMRYAAVIPSTEVTPKCFL